MPPPGLVPCLQSQAGLRRFLFSNGANLFRAFLACWISGSNMALKLMTASGWRFCLTPRRCCCQEDWRLGMGCIFEDRVTHWSAYTHVLSLLQLSNFFLYYRWCDIILENLCFQSPLCYLAFLKPQIYILPLILMQACLCYLDHCGIA